MTEIDRSSYDKLNPMERRTFLRGLVASAVVAGAGLPVGLEELSDEVDTAAITFYVTFTVDPLYAFEQGLT